MTFTYSYKDSTGARRDGEIEADSKSQAYGMLKARGIAPLNLTMSSKKAPSEFGKPNVAIVLKGAIGGILVVVATIVAWSCLSASRKDVVARNVSKVAGEVPPNKKGSPAKVETNNGAVPAGAKKLEKKTLETSVETSVVTTSAVENAGIATNLHAKKTAKRPFKTGVEQVMGWIFTTPLGSTPPPLPNLSKKDMDNLVTILMSKSKIEEGDSEKTADVKETVNAAKKEFLKYLKEGGDPSGFLPYYHNELKKASDTWRDAQKLVLQTLKEDAATGIAFAEEVNKKLAEQGIKPVKVPPKYLTVNEGDAK